MRAAKAMKAAKRNAGPAWLVPSLSNAMAAAVVIVTAARRAILLTNGTLARRWLTFGRVDWVVEQHRGPAADLQALDLPDPVTRTVRVLEPTAPALVLGSSQ